MGPQKQRVLAEMMMFYGGSSSISRYHLSTNREHEELLALYLGNLGRQVSTWYFGTKTKMLKTHLEHTYFRVVSHWVLQGQGLELDKIEGLTDRVTFSFCRKPNTKLII